LLLGYYDEEGKLRYAGKVGTGFTQKSLEELKKKLDEIETHQNPFTGAVERAGEIHWVKPALVAEVSFWEWTDHGHIRHPSFRGLRTEKKAEQITREKPVKLNRGKRA
jgi:bifunctional non-homologous end joining protein LigD